MRASTVIIQQLLLWVAFKVVDFGYCPRCLRTDETFLHTASVEARLASSASENVPGTHLFMPKQHVNRVIFDIRGPQQMFCLVFSFQKLRQVQMPIDSNLYYIVNINQVNSHCPNSKLWGLQFGLQVVNLSTLINQFVYIEIELLKMNLQLTIWAARNQPINVHHWFMYIEIELLKMAKICCLISFHNPVQFVNIVHISSE